MGLTPLQDELAAIDKLQQKSELAAILGQLQQDRYGSPVALFVGQDQKDSSQYIVSVSQSGLGLPDRDYYLKTDEKSEQIKKQYQWMIAKFWELAGWPEGGKAAETMFCAGSKNGRSAMEPDPKP